MKNQSIPQIEPWIDHRELEQLKEVIDSTFITENRKTEQFLEAIRTYTGSRYAMAMSNGTIALIAALLAEGIGAGDEVIVPDLTFIASSNAILLAGAKPVFCDVLRKTGCLDPQACEKLITSRTRAIMPVHLYGQAVDMRAIMQMAERHDLCVIEDAAESFGVHIDGIHTGTFGHYGVFSFFANKTITCGEGGVVLTNTEEREKQLFRIKNHGRDKKGVYIHEQVGFNFCFTDLQAAIGVAQMGKLDEILASKRETFAHYQEGLSGIEGLQVMDVPENIRSNYWFSNILVDDPQALSDGLRQVGIETRRFFYPLHKQPCYAGDYPQDFPASDWLYEHGLSLPSGATLTESQRKEVCQAVRGFFS